MSASSFTLKADSGATNHYIKPIHERYLISVEHVHNGPLVRLPNNEQLPITKKGLLPLPTVPSQRAQQANILPLLTNSSLLSIGQLCDDDCWGVFNKKMLLMFKNYQLLLHGIRNKQDGLWDVHLPSKVRSDPPLHSANVITKLDKSNYELANFYHGCMFSPTIRTLHTMIRNNHLVTWPGVNKLNFQKSIVDTTAVEMGHLKQEKKHLRSTKVTPPSSESRTRTYEIHSKVITFNAKEMPYGDMTGAFPYTSTRGNKYIYLMYDYDSNGILVHPLKNRQAAEITTAWVHIHQRFTKHGHTIKHFILDNEMSDTIKKAFTKNGVTYQAVPPHMHRANAAERFIQTFKDHLLSGLATCDPEFPINEWDRLLPQCEMTLNLLLVARCNPKLSAYTYLEGLHDFNKAPLAPPGTKVIIYKKPGARSSWSYHGEQGWYVGPALNHYRCYRCFLPRTGREIITDTVKFIPHKIKFPAINFVDKMRTMVNKIVHLLTSHPTQIPLPPCQHAAVTGTFNHLAKIFTMPSPQPSPHIMPYTSRHHQTMLIATWMTKKHKPVPLLSVPPNPLVFPLGTSHSTPLPRVPSTSSTPDLISPLTPLPRVQTKPLHTDHCNHLNHTSSTCVDTH